MSVEHDRHPVIAGVPELEWATLPMAARPRSRVEGASRRRTRSVRWTAGTT